MYTRILGEIRFAKALPMGDNHGMEGHTRRPDEAPDGNRIVLVRSFAIPAITITTVLAIGIEIVCLSIGLTGVFQNLFYLPILITAGRYPGKALAFTTGCCAVYAALVLGPFGFREELTAVMVRVAFFELISYVVSYMSTRCGKAEVALRAQLTNLNEIVHEQTEYISRELEQSHQLEMAYRNATKYHEMVLGQTGAAIMIWNPEDYVTKVNPALSELLGIESSELIGRKIQTVLPVAERGATGYPFRMETSLRVLDGRPRRALWTVTEITDAERDTVVARMAVGQELPDQYLTLY